MILRNRFQFMVTTRVYILVSAFVSPFHHYGQGRRQGKSLGERRNLGGAGGRAPWWGSGGEAP